MKTAASIFSIMFFGSVLCQSVADLKVKVMDFDNKGKSGETVVFVSEDKTIHAKTVSDESGECRVKLTGGHTYDIYVEAIGMQIKNNQITVPELAKGAQYTEALLQIFFEMPQKLTLDNLRFDTGKWSIQSSSFEQLKQLATYLKNNPDINLAIYGYTDNVGDDQSNLTLSEKRAEAVKNYLIQQGVSADRLQSQGFGENNPVADNSTESGRKQNRRTEVVFI
ncbi:MAG: OmpA family protein [Crocinitomicaceae bacterium]